MKKNIYLIVLLVCTAFMLFSCHGARKRAEFEMPETLDTLSTYEITFWAKNDTNKYQTEVYNNAIEAFQELYPNVKVNMRLYNDYGKIYNDVITNISTGTTPNVCITYPDHIATYISGKNTVVPLDSLMNDKNYGLGGEKLIFDSPKAEEIIYEFLSEGKLSGVQYALPFMRSTEACYINKSYVEALGYTLPEKLTWDFVFEVSKAATKMNDDGTYALSGQKVMLPFIYKSTDNMMIQMLKQKNADYSNDKGDILIFNDTTKEILYNIAELTENEAFSTFKVSGYPGNFLNAGQCVFAIDSTAGSTWMGTKAPNIDISKKNLVDFEIEVMPIPQFDTQNPKMISQGPSICIFNKDDKNEVLYSWLFAQFMLTNEVQLGYCMTEGYIPVTTKATESAEYKNYLSRAGEDTSLYYDVKIKASKILIDNIQNTFITPVFNGSTSLRNASGQMIENVTKSVRRKEKVDEKYMSALFEDVSSLYRLDGKMTAK